MRLIFHVLVISYLGASLSSCSNGQMEPGRKEESGVPAHSKPAASIKASGDDRQLPAFQQDNRNYAQFIPAGYKLLDSASGDLNLDDYKDMILVLGSESKVAASSADTSEKRPLMLLTGKKGGGYTLAARNDNTVLCTTCGGAMGDPYMEVVIRHGFFSIEHYGGSGWRWSRVITYHYSPADKNWWLFKDGNESFHAAEPEKVERKILTAKNFGRIAFQEFNIYEEENIKNR